MACLGGVIPNPVARQWLGAAIPAEAIKSLRPTDFTPEVIDWARGQFLSPLRSVPLVGVHAARFLGDEAPRQRLAALLSGIFPPLQEMRANYHLPPVSPWAWAYYPLRFWRFFIRDLPATLRSWRGDARMALVINHAAHSRQFQQWLVETPNPGVDHPGQHFNGATD